MSIGVNRAWQVMRRHPARALGTVAVAAVVTLSMYTALRYAWPTNPLAEVEAALARYDFTAAQRQLAARLHDQPDDAAAHFLAARTERYLGNFTRAAEHLRRARKLGYSAGTIELEHLLARASQRRDPAMLAQLQARADAGGPDTAAILEVLVQAYLDAYRLREAAGALDKLLLLQPANVKALLGRGRVKERLFDFGAATADYRAAVELVPADDEARVRLAAALLVNGKPDEAIAEYETLRQHQGDTPAVLLGLARCRRQQGQLTEALALLDQLLAHTPDHAAALAERGKVALELGRPAEAVTALRRAIALAPHDREARHNLYQCLRLTGPPTEAAAALAAYQQLDADLRRLDKVTSAVVADPGNLTLRCEGADLFFRLGEPEEAVRWLRAVLTLDPNHAGAQHALAAYARPAKEAARPVNSPNSRVP